MQIANLNENLIIIVNTICTYNMKCIQGHAVFHCSLLFFDIFQVKRWGGEMPTGVCGMWLLCSIRTNVLFVLGSVGIVTGADIGSNGTVASPNRDSNQRPTVGDRSHLGYNLK